MNHMISVDFALTISELESNISWEKSANLSTQMYQFKTLTVPDFLSREAPPNYIAGLGRGATGFTTGADVGSAIDDGSALATALAASQGKGPRQKIDDQNLVQDPDNETGLFNAAPYEQDDEEADRIWEQVERGMDERRKKKREIREEEEVETLRAARPKIQDQFADLKRDLASVSSEEWAAIPDVQDMVRKRGSKKNRVDVYERLSSVPDSILLQGASQSKFDNSLDQDATTKTDFVQFGKARDRVLGLKLDQVSDSVSGQTTIDPKGYLSSLGNTEIKSDAEVSDIKKARTLLKSVIQTNPKHSPGWIAAARLEEVALKSSAARDIIAKGCEACPKNEDVWLEAARLNIPEKAKKILSEALRNIPLSINIWLKSKDLESDIKSQKKILRKALEQIPNSIKLWKAAISAEEDPNDAKTLLARAVECVPLNVELWLALARLETHLIAQKILNKALKANPASQEIWMAAAKLEEQHGSGVKVELIVNRAVTDLTKRGITFERENWIAEAESCESDGFLVVCRAIVRKVIGINIDEEDQILTWTDDADQSSKKKFTSTARFIYEFAIETFPENESLYIDTAFFEKAYGNKDTLLNFLGTAVEACAQAEVLWLMYAKETWMGGDAVKAKKILGDAFEIKPNSESIWLAAVKLEIETGSLIHATSLLAQARQKSNTGRIWMKSVVIERALMNFDNALELVNQAILSFPLYYKLWVIKGQILHDDMNLIAESRLLYSLALKKLPKISLLWIQASRLEEKCGLATKARAILERARLLNPKDADLWYEGIQVEKRSGNLSMSKALLAKGLQECPKSGILWCENIMMESRPQRKARSTDALRNCENDALVVTTIARLFWNERKFDKARNWFERACKTNPDLGDSWAWWYKFELVAGRQDQQEAVYNQCIVAGPRHGALWQLKSKDLTNIDKKTGDILNILSTELEISF